MVVRKGRNRFVFDFELGFHKVDEGNEGHSRWKENGSMKYGVLGKFE